MRQGGRRRELLHRLGNARTDADPRSERPLSRGRCADRIWPPRCAQLLGPDVKIGYAADWSEYFGYQPQDGSGDRYFHLDPLWADENIDFIGIDNYMPLSDWRDGQDHADANWGSIYDLNYLKANIEGGEGYDWYYHSPEAAAAQIRTPITDDAYGEPWIWRYKDIRNWWPNAHHDRIAGVRAARAEPRGCRQSKPIRFTEIGCAAIDKGTNEPNKFVDAEIVGIGSAADFRTGSAMI